MRLLILAVLIGLITALNGQPDKKCTFFNSVKTLLINF